MFNIWTNSRSYLKYVKETYNLHFIRQDSVKIVCDLQHVHYLGNILIVATKDLFRDVMCTSGPRF